MNLKQNGIYIIENKNNKEIYIGSTIVTFEKRFKQHKALLKKGEHHSTKLQEVYNTLGLDGLEFKVLEEISDFSKVRVTEKEWIDTLYPEYNMTHNVNISLVYDQKLKIKMSRGHGGKPFEAYKDGVLVGIFDLQNDAAKELGVPQADLQRVLAGKYFCAKGYNFKYVGEDFKYISKVIPKKQKKEKCKARLLAWETRRKKGITTSFKRDDKEVQLKRARSIFKGVLKAYKDGILVGEFLSLGEASESLNIKKQSISQVMGGHRETVFGYKLIKEKLNA